MTPEEKRVIEMAIAATKARYEPRLGEWHELYSAVGALEASRQAAPEDGLEGPH